MASEKRTVLLDGMNSLRSTGLHFHRKYSNIAFIQRDLLHIVKKQGVDLFYFPNCFKHPRCYNIYYPTPHSGLIYANITAIISKLTYLAF